LLFAIAASSAIAQKAQPAPAAGEKSTTEEAIEKKLQLPGIKINLKERCVDVDASVCLDRGTLELVACTKNTKEHESIVAIEAKPIHIHTALLLLGAKEGNPAMRKQVGEGDQLRWVDIPPRGSEVVVSLVFKNKEGKQVERPISDFIKRSEEGGTLEEERTKKFPTSTFLFAGSHLHEEADGVRQYLAGLSGNVISVATFGDEVMCLPDINGHEKGSLLWQIDATYLPAIESKVTLRLRPLQKPNKPEATAK